MSFDVTKSVTPLAEEVKQEPKPAYKFLYAGYGDGEYDGDKAIAVAKAEGFENITWGSEGLGWHGFYNGDMWLLYNDPNDLPKGYKEDALAHGESVAKMEADIAKAMAERVEREKGGVIMSESVKPAVTEQKFYLNRVKDDLIYHDKAEDGKSAQVRVALPQLSGEEGLIYARVDANKTFPAVGREGKPVPGYSNVNLGSSQVEILRPVAGEDGKKHYQSEMMDAKDLATQFNEARKQAGAARRAEQSAPGVDSIDRRADLARQYDNLDEKTARRLPDSVVSDMALAAQEEAEDRALGIN